MQQNKLQELTDKLYKEGLSKGQQEAEELLARAKNEAQQTLAKAKEEAAQIIADAQKTAAAAKTASDNELRLAARQVMATVKQAIENIVTAKVVGEPVKNTVSEKEFLQKLILTAVGRFDPQQTDAHSLSLLLPADMQRDLQTFADEQLQKQLKQGLSVQFDKSFKAGFKIGVAGSGFHVSLTDQDFEKLFGYFLRTRLNNLLFAAPH